MGSLLATRRDLESAIESDYKSVRKYCDEVYGEITVLKKPGSKEQYALIQHITDVPQKFE